MGLSVDGTAHPHRDGQKRHRARLRVLARRRREQTVRRVPPRASRRRRRRRPSRLVLRVVLAAARVVVVGFGILGILLVVLYVHTPVPRAGLGFSLPSLGFAERNVPLRLDSPRRLRGDEILGGERRSAPELAQLVRLRVPVALEEPLERALGGVPEQRERGHLLVAGRHADVHQHRRDAHPLGERHHGRGVLALLARVHRAVHHAHERRGVGQAEHVFGERRGETRRDARDVPGHAGIQRPGLEQRRRAIHRVRDSASPPPIRDARDGRVPRLGVVAA